MGPLSGGRSSSIMKIKSGSNNASVTIQANRHLRHQTQTSLRLCPDDGHRGFHSRHHLPQLACTSKSENGIEGCRSGTNAAKTLGLIEPAKNVAGER